MTQEQALDILKMGKNVFLTGSAGSGKTYMLNQYIAFLKSRGVTIGVTASTGIAATHMDGMTIHAWSGVGVRNHLSERDLVTVSTKAPIRRRFLRTQVLVIDEVSMIHAHMLDMIDTLARTIRENDEPFGGMQVIVTGDFFQLPPVSRDGVAAFATEAQAWKDAHFTICYLQTQYRHSGDALTTILNDIRSGTVSEKTKQLLIKQKDAVLKNESIQPTQLYTHNMDVDAINARALAKLDTEARRYNMLTDGPAPLVEALTRSCLAPQELIVRLGAVVMFVRNNFEEGYVNGTLGTVTSFTERGFPVVATFSGDEIIAKPESWAIEEDGKTKASLRQIPLRLAWAITIHKSQGMTLDAAEIDLSKSFVPGMGYVALSRVRSLEGLLLHGFNDVALDVNEDVLIEDRDFQERSCEAINMLEEISKESLREQQEGFLERVGKKSKQPKESAHEKTRKMIEKGMSIDEIAQERGLVIGTIIGHLEKIKNGDEYTDLTVLKSKIAEKRMKKIHATLRSVGVEVLTPVRKKLGAGYSFDEIRLARLFLDQ